MNDNIRSCSLHRILVRAFGLYAHRFDRLAARVLVTILLTAIPGALSWADVAGPGWFRAQADPVSPEIACAYYLQQEASAKNALESAHTSYAPASETSIASPTEATPEITELARGLRHDPRLIYDYVHNHIDYVPYYGSLKGATLTYLDGCGNDFDQASLMIALLRASGYTARYNYGTMTFPFTLGSPLANWIGSDDNYASVLSSGGVPLAFSGSDVNVTRVWVKATISGTDYVFDPAWKLYSSAPRMDIAQAMGYDRAQLLSAAGGTSTSDYVQNLNEAAVTSKLSTYASALVSTIRSQHPNDNIEQVLGRRSVVQTELAQYPTTLSYPNAVQSTWDDIPAAQTATMRVQHYGIDYTFAIPEIAARRITITYSATDHRPELRLDGQLVASGNPTTLGSFYDMVISIDHPYAANSGTYCDQSNTYSNKSGSTYAIIYNFGGTAEAIVSKRQRLIDDYRAAGQSQASESVLGETLNVMGLSWLRQTEMAKQLLSDISDVICISHHRIGRMAQENGYYVDVMTQFSSTISKDYYDQTNQLPVFQSTVNIGSSFEHGVLEQTMGSQIPGVSTVKLLQIGNAAGGKTFRATSANFAAIRSQLTGYSTSQLDSFASQLSSNQVSWLMLPQNGQLTLNQWRGTGYIQWWSSGSSYSQGMIISGGLYGGYSSLPGTVDPDTVKGDSWWDNRSATWSWNGKTFSVDPVEMSSGSFNHQHVDLSLTGTKSGMAFSRIYHSSRNRSQTALGYGWTHNHDIRASPISHGEMGLGGRKPVDAAALIAALYVSLDMHKNEDTIRGWVLGSLVDKWAVDRLIDNAVNVSIGDQIAEYVKLPDGNYEPSPGSTTQLSNNGNGTYSLIDRFGPRMDFDSTGRVVSASDADGNFVAYTYTSGNLTRIQDSSGRCFNLSYGSGRLAAVTDSSGRSVSYGYDGNGNLCTFTDAQGKVWSYGFDSDHHMTSLVNPLGVATASNTYDSLGRVASQTVPRQGGTTATYSICYSGYRNFEQDPLGNCTTYFYDAKSRLVGVEDALGYRSTRKYDCQGHVIEAKDARGNISSNLYDGAQNLVCSTNALGEITSFLYDSQLRLSSIADSLGHTTSYTYDAKHHLVSTIDALGYHADSSYYPNGLKRTSTDQRGTTTTQTYDDLGNPASSQTGSHPLLSFIYDPAGRMTRLTDQAGAATTFTYDNRGLLLSKTDPLGRATTSNYDAVGRVTSTTDRNGQTVTYTYTPTGKPSNVTVPGLPAITFAYDSRDIRTAMSDGLGTTIYNSDATGRLTSLTDPQGFAVSYTYDPGGNVASITYPGNKIISYSYDALNRIRTVTNWLSQTATYTYDLVGRLVRLDNFNGTTTTYGYDNANRLVSLANLKSDTSAIATYRFTLDGNGNPVQVSQYEPLPCTPTPESIGYAYNAQRNRLLSAGGTSYGWDFEGQMTGTGATPYTFDGAHRLVGTGGTIPCQYAYDGGNRRLRANRGGVFARYIYDPSGNLLAEADASNNIVAYYVYGSSLLARMTPGGATYCYHFNSVGSTIAITDLSQNTANQYAYDSYGKVTSQSETIAQPFKFVGQFGVVAEPNGFYYMRARYYDPITGRFISEDPTGFSGGDTNLFAYCGNRPAGLTDPSGFNGSNQFTNDVTVYFNQSDATGHAAIKVGDQYLSRYPMWQDNWRDWGIMLWSAPAVYKEQNEDNEEFQYQLTFKVTDDEAAKMVEELRQIKSKDKYNFVTINCSEAVSSVLNAGGVAIGAEGISPWTLRKALRFSTDNK